MISLRAWQGEAIPVVARTLRGGRPALVSACTGAGKSIFLTALLADVLGTLRDGWCVVVTVPTQALVEQLAGTLRLHLGASVVGRWYGRRKEGGRVRVCCLPSLESLVDELEIAGIRCALWIGDEVHRAEAYADQVARLAPRCRLGVTATPYRSDTGLTLWPEVTYRYTMERAISEGVLVPPRIVGWYGERIPMLDALQQMLPDVAGIPGVVGAANIADAETLAGELPIPAAPIHSRMGSPERARLLAALESGDIAALVHVRLLSEGVDLPWLRWLGLTTRHSRTKLGLVQEVGRVLRCAPGKTEGIVLDPLGLCLAVGLVHPADLVEAADKEEPEPEIEVDEIERLPPDIRPVYAVPLDALQRWLIEQRWGQMRYPPRPGAATSQQIEAMEKARRKLRWLDGPTRAALERLMAAPSIDRQTAAAVLDTLYAASRAAKQHFERTASWNTAPRLRMELP